MFVEHKEAGELKALDQGSAILLRAAELLEEKGHCNSGAYGTDGSLCVHAAMLEVVGDNERSSALLAARKKLEQNLNETITWWSNSSTKDEVIAKLRAVAFSS